MDNNPAHEVTATNSSAPKWVGIKIIHFYLNDLNRLKKLKQFQRQLIRQYSDKVSTFAEDVALPKNERLLRQASRTEDLSMRNIEAQYPHPSTATLYNQREPSRHFPIFMVTISLVQVIVTKKVFQNF